MSIDGNLRIWSTSGGQCIHADVLVMEPSSSPNKWGWSVQFVDRTLLPSKAVIESIKNPSDLEDDENGKSQAEVLPAWCIEGVEKLRAINSDTDLKWNVPETQRHKYYVMCSTTRSIRLFDPWKSLSPMMLPNNSSIVSTSTDMNIRNFVWMNPYNCLTNHPLFQLLSRSMREENDLDRTRIIFSIPLYDHHDHECTCTHVSDLFLMADQGGQAEIVRIDKNRSIGILQCMCRFRINDNAPLAGVFITHECARGIWSIHALCLNGRLFCAELRLTNNPLDTSHRMI